MDILRAFLVLIASISLLFFLTYLFRLTFNISRRLAMLQAFVTVGGLAWFITEMLGAFRAITFIGLAITWGIAGLSTILMLARISGGNFIRVIFTDLQDMRGYLLSLPRGLLAVLLCILVGMLILGVTAFVAAPNTWDSMTYHLSRVMHWEQNQSLAFYPTSISRQLYLGP
ncbi:MAG TPA: hypothetical protein VLT51_09455, partial [Anaerolineales bacterium]|nr:hypothetical protein [Anaerolineales bacterium]